ncbi:MAG: calcineurin-like phosphoesterase family protein [Clostridium sp.]|nr:calcineurin-like phosphoesterase family protein [Bacteroides sp.]MCM1197847.1 calcineurin-like phosphoesterase family protein [Clostridium sp.]
MKRLATFIILLCGALMPIATACSDKVMADNTAIRDRLVTGTSIPNSVIYTTMARQFTIQGKGYLEGDKIALVSGETELPVDVTAVDSHSITISLENEIPSGKYIVVLVRGTQRQTLGTIELKSTISLEVPDKDGMNFKGIVFCGKNPVAGAVVSDGVTLTETDDNGFWWLQSNKSYGFVFVSVPTGYEVETKDGIPQFFHRTGSDITACEQVNFELYESNVKDGDEFVVTHVSDMHLANRLKDAAQFTGGFAADIARMAFLDNRKVISINTGDMSFDTYWKSNGYDLEDYSRTLKECEFDFPMFHVPGNHDNDAYSDSDVKAEQPFKDYIGPTYYSFNMGGIHFIMLDSVIYLNDGGSSSTKGSMNYINGLTSTQFAWLQQDIATIKDKDRPVFVCLHCPMNGYDSSFTPKNALDNGDAIINCFNDFPEVHVLSGHTHNNYTIKRNSNILEHNVGAVCATWWWTGYYDFVHICKDGTPGGYGVYEFNNNSVSWYYHGIDYDDKRQFRAYDMNKVKEYLNTDSGYLQLCKSYPARNNDYAGIGQDVILINAWNWDEDWKIEVTENGKPLEVVHSYLRDPLHTICYDGPRVLRTSSHTLTESFQSGNNFHMFTVQASSPTSTVAIKVTDRFGRIYTETMSRPKAFSANVF